MSMIYHLATKAFHLPDTDPALIPGETTIISDALYTSLIEGQDEDNEIDHGVDGVPLLVPRPPPTLSAEQQAELDKRTGVLFDGVMCSATSEDMWGLKSVEDIVASGIPVNFYFDNGNVLVLTDSNMVAFQAVWVPFRLSFFT